MCKEHIKALKQVIKGRNTLPILKCIAHTNGKLIATDLTVMVQIDTPTIRDGIWSGEVLDMGFREELLSTEFTIEDYPELPELTPIQELELSGEDMEKILRAGEFISKDTTRPVLTGVAIVGDKVYGTDGYKMYRNAISNSVSEQVILPTECIKVLKAVKAGKHNWTLDVYGEDQVAFKSGSITIFTKTIYGTLPQYEILLSNTKADTLTYIDLNETTGAKGYQLVIDREKGTTELYNPNTKQRINLGSGRVDTGNILYGDGAERNVVMPMAKTQKNTIAIDLDLLKPYAKKKVKLYNNPHNNQVEVEII